MNANTVTTTTQAPTLLPAPVQNLLLIDVSRTFATGSARHYDLEHLELRANTVTVLLHEMMERDNRCHGYQHFGIND